MPYSRIYNFVALELLREAEVDAEFDNIISALNNYDGANIRDNTIPASKISGGLTGGLFGDGTINGSKLIDGTVTGAKLADLTITGSKIADNTIPFSKLQAGTGASLYIPFTTTAKAINNNTGNASGTLNFTTIGTVPVIPTNARIIWLDIEYHLAHYRTPSGDTAGTMSVVMNAKTIINHNFSLGESNTFGGINQWYSKFYPLLLTVGADTVPYTIVNSFTVPGLTANNLDITCMGYSL